MEYSSHPLLRFFALIQTNQYPHSLAFHRKDYREMAIKGLASITSTISKPLKDCGSPGLGSGTWCPVTLQGQGESLRNTLTSERCFVRCECAPTTSPQAKNFDGTTTGVTQKQTRAQKGNTYYTSCFTESLVIPLRLTSSSVRL